MNESNLMEKTLTEEIKYSRALLLRIKELSEENAKLKEQIEILEKKKGF